MTSGGLHLEREQEYKMQITQRGLKMSKATELLNKAKVNEASFPSNPELADYLTRLLMGDPKIALNQLKKVFMGDTGLKLPKNPEEFNASYTKVWQIFNMAVDKALKELR